MQPKRELKLEIRDTLCSPFKDKNDKEEMTLLTRIAALDVLHIDEAALRHHKKITRREKQLALKVTKKRKMIRRKHLDPKKLSKKSGSV